MLEGSNIPLSENPTMAELARELLLYKMREYSDAMCASWLSNAEFDIWELGEPGASDPGEPGWQRQNGLTCRKLGTLAGGWWVYGRARHQDGEAGWTGENPHFIALTEWTERHAAWREDWLAQSRGWAQEAAAAGMEPEAAERWGRVSAGDRAAFLRNHVWCGHCRKGQPMEASGGQAAFLGHGLWLTGTCPGCGGLLRTEYRGEAPAG